MAEVTGGHGHPITDPAEVRQVVRRAGASAGVGFEEIALLDCRADLDRVSQELVNALYLRLIAPILASGRADGQSPVLAGDEVDRAVFDEACLLYTSDAADE